MRGRIGGFLLRHADCVKSHSTGLPRGNSIRAFQPAVTPPEGVAP
jgi:hypothetical protein